MGISGCLPYTLNAGSAEAIEDLAVDVKTDTAHLAGNLTGVFGLPFFF